MAKIIPIDKNNSLYSDKNKLFKFLLIFYKFIYMFLGLDFGFIKFKCIGIKVIPKVLAIFLCIFVSVLTLYDNIIHDYDLEVWYLSMWYSVFVVQYLAYVIILLRIKDESTFCYLIQDLRSIDLGLKVHHASYNLELKLFSTIFIFFAYRVSIYAVYCIQFSVCRGVFGRVFFIMMMIVAADIVRITYAFMFYAINCRLQKIESLLKEKPSDFSSIQYLYKSIVDIAEQHKDSFDPVLITALLFNVPQVMVTMYASVKELQMYRIGSISLDLSSEYVTILEMLTLTIMPAICAGMLTSEANNIKVILHDLLLKTQDDKQFREIERFIGYVSARKCRFHVCKVIPLDADLLGMVLGFCVTYLIVIIQFTNK